MVLRNWTTQPFLCLNLKRLSTPFCFFCCWVPYHLNFCFFFYWVPYHLNCLFVRLFSAFVCVWKEHTRWCLKDTPMIAGSCSCSACSQYRDPAAEHESSPLSVFLVAKHFIHPQITDDSEPADKMTRLNRYQTAFGSLVLNMWDQTLKIVVSKLNCYKLGIV